MRRRFRVGDKVRWHTRDQVRPAVVRKVGPKRVQVEWGVFKLTCLSWVDPKKLELRV